MNILVCMWEFLWGVYLAVEVRGWRSYPSSALSESANSSLNWVYLFILTPIIFHLQHLVSQDLSIFTNLIGVRWCGLILLCNTKFQEATDQFGSNLRRGKMVVKEFHSTWIIFHPSGNRHSQMQSLLYNFHVRGDLGVWSG